MDQGMSTIMMMAILFAIMYFFMIRPENKRKKKAEEMRNGLQKGNVVTTIGGIVGKIVMVNADTIIIETSEDRVRMELTKWAVSTVGLQTSEQPDNKKTEPAPAEEPAEESVESPVATEPEEKE